MNAVPVLFTLWWLALVGLLGFLASSAFNNRFIVGIRTYPRAEHRRRYEQWMILPLIGLFTSMATGIATGLIITGGWGMLWGFNALAGTFFITVNLGLWLGLVRRAKTSPTWEPNSSLEAIHAEVTAHPIQGDFSESLLSAYVERLRSMREELNGEKEGLQPDLSIYGLSWQDCPRAGFGPIRNSDNIVVRVPAKPVLKFLRRRILLLVVAILSSISALLLFLPASVNVRTVAAVTTMAAIPPAVAFMAARAELVYRQRSRLEREVMIREASEAIELIRPDGPAPSSTGASRNSSVKDRRTKSPRRQRTRRIAGRSHQRNRSPGCAREMH